MFGRGVLDGLAGSAFIADVDARDRAPLHIVGSVLGGFVVGAVAAVAAMILVLAIYVLVSGHGPEGLAGITNLLIALRDEKTASLSSTVLQLFLDTGVNLAFALAFVATAALIVTRRFWVFITIAARFRWRLVVAGTALSLLVLAPLFIVDRIVSGTVGQIPLIAISPHWSSRAGYVLASLLFIPAAAAEELVFRGWLLRQLAAFVRRPLILLLGTGCLFAVLHLDFNPDSLLTRTLMGAGFAYMTLRLGGIEFSIGAHAANNMLIMLLIQPLTLQLPQPTSSISPLSLIEDAVLVAGYILITEAVARSSVLGRLTGLRPEEVSATSDFTSERLAGPPR